MEHKKNIKTGVVIFVGVFGGTYIISKLSGNTSTDKGNNLPIQNLPDFEGLHNTTNNNNTFETFNNLINENQMIKELSDEDFIEKYPFPIYASKNWTDDKFPPANGIFHPGYQAVILNQINITTGNYKKTLCWGNKVNLPLHEIVHHTQDVMRGKGGTAAYTDPKDCENLLNGLKKFEKPEDQHNHNALVIGVYKLPGIEHNITNANITAVCNDAVKYNKAPLFEGEAYATDSIGVKEVKAYIPNTPIDYYLDQYVANDYQHHFNNTFVEKQQKLMKNNINIVELAGNGSDYLNFLNKECNKTQTRILEGKIKNS